MKMFKCPKCSTLWAIPGKEEPKEDREEKLCRKCSPPKPSGPGIIIR